MEKDSPRPPAASDLSPSPPSSRSSSSTAPLRGSADTGRASTSHQPSGADAGADEDYAPDTPVSKRLGSDWACFIEVWRHQYTLPSWDHTAVAYVRRDPSDKTGTKHIIQFYCNHGDCPGEMGLLYEEGYHAYKAEQKKADWKGNPMVLASTYVQRDPHKCPRYLLSCDMLRDAPNKGHFFTYAAQQHVCNTDSTAQIWSFMRGLLDPVRDLNDNPTWMKQAYILCTAAVPNHARMGSLLLIVRNAFARKHEAYTDAADLFVKGVSAMASASKGHVTFADQTEGDTPPSVRRLRASTVTRPDEKDKEEAGIGKSKGDGTVESMQERILTADKPTVGTIEISDGLSRHIWPEADDDAGDDRTDAAMAAMAPAPPLDEDRKGKGLDVSDGEDEEDKNADKDEEVEDKADKRKGKKKKKEQVVDTATLIKTPAVREIKKGKRVRSDAGWCRNCLLPAMYNCWAPGADPLFHLDETTGITVLEWTDVTGAVGGRLSYLSLTSPDPGDQQTKTVWLTLWRSRALFHPTTMLGLAKGGMVLGSLKLYAPDAPAAVTSSAFDIHQQPFILPGIEYVRKSQALPLKPLDRTFHDPCVNVRTSIPSSWKKLAFYKGRQTVAPFDDKERIKAVKASYAQGKAEYAAIVGAGGRTPRRPPTLPDLGSPLGTLHAAVNRHQLVHHPRPGSVSGGSSSTTSSSPLSVDGRSSASAVSSPRASSKKI